MKILIFLHGTTIMHHSGRHAPREIRVQQSRNRESSVLDYANYVPIGNAVEKLKSWIAQGVEINYLSSHQDGSDIEKDKQVLKRFGFPEGEVLYRRSGEEYKDVAEKITPDILIEDDCESICGEGEMVYPHIDSQIKTRIKSVVVKEFEGIDHLPELVSKL